MVNKILNLIVALLLFAAIFISIDDSVKVWSGKDQANEITVEQLATGAGGIFSNYVFSFELLSLLLIAALIGALYLAKREVL
ncbi:NADH-ubiquinone/plastoquinone oxidoreductase chain 6 [uncultured archaeon]|nr:NADH-ubiquinone/plastoquinone oxidoreductase chain 6 [uncultured archaeon]